jgi:hypothetical protein
MKRRAAHASPPCNRCEKDLSASEPGSLNAHETTQRKRPYPTKIVRQRHLVNGRGAPVFTWKHSCPDMPHLRAEYLTCRCDFTLAARHWETTKSSTTSLQFLLHLCISRYSVSVRCSIVSVDHSEFVRDSIGYQQQKKTRSRDLLEVAFKLRRQQHGRIAARNHATEKSRTNQGCRTTRPDQWNSL